MPGAVQNQINAIQRMREKKLRDKPWKTCAWYPAECDSGGCECGDGSCGDYISDEELDERWRPIADELEEYLKCSAKARKSGLCA